MRKIEKEEEHVAYEDPDKKIYHLCIVNLVIGSVYDMTVQTSLFVQERTKCVSECSPLAQSHTCTHTYTVMRAHNHRHHHIISTVTHINAHTHFVFWPVACDTL